MFFFIYKANTLVERKVSSTQSDVTVVVIDGEPTNTEVQIVFFLY
jgi:hypothetical protein